MTNLSLNLSFHETHNVRIQLVNGDPWFCLKDVCEVLGLTTASPARFQLDEKGVARNATPTESGNQDITFINEPNLYRVIFRSNKPEAKQFQDWVFNDVLPTIRKTGSYNHPAKTDDEFLTTKEMDNLKHLIWSMSSKFHYKDSCSFAIHKALRTISHTPSPGKFRVNSLPILAEEIKRIYKIAEYVHARVVEIEKRAVELIRNGEDASEALLEIDKLISTQRHQEASIIFTTLGKWEEKRINNLLQRH